MNLYQPTITGSLSVSGSINISGSINVVGGGGTITGTASYATNAELLDGLDSTVFTLTSSFAAQTASFTAFTSSVNTFTASINSFSASVLSYTSSLNAKTSSFATTGSNTFEGIQTINSNLIVTGSITAQTLVVQTITSSVDFVTGSTRFGSILGNTHVFSGSVTMNPGGLFVSSSGNVGIGTITPIFNTNNTSKGLDITNVAGFSSLTLHGSGSQEAGICGGGNAQGLFLDVAGDANAANNNISFRNTSTNSSSAISTRMFISSSGNIGIGTTTPGTKLEVLSTAANADRTIPHNVLTITAEQGNAPYGFFGGAILFKNRSYTSGLVESSRIRSVIYDDGAPSNFGGGLWFETTPTPGGALTSSLVINYQGRVGIGATNPVTALEVLPSITNSSIKTGGIEIQSYAVNNGWIADNMYYSGSWKARATGHSTQIYFGNGTISFTRAASTGSGATISPITSMVIDTAGIITKPNHPVFHVARSAGNVSSATTVVWNVVYTNIGSYYNSANGRFTAPTAGVYYFAFSVMSDGDLGMDMALQKNDVTYQGCVPLQSAIGSPYNQITGLCTITLAAGDYVTIYNSSGTVYASNSNGGRHTMFCGYLIG